MEGGTDYTSTASSQGWPGSSLPALSPYTESPQVKAEAGSIRGIDEESRGPYAEYLLPQSTFPGHEGVQTAPIEDPTRINHTGLDATYGSCKGDILSCTVASTVVKVSGKNHAAVTSQATVQPAVMHGTPKSQFSCDKCNRKYAQRQGVTRHQREVHETNLCPICNTFRWGRRYQLNKHLSERHGINLGKPLRKTTRCRREAPMNKKYLRQKQASPAMECNIKSPGEPLPRSLMRTLPTVAKDSHVTLPATLSMAYDSHSGHAGNPVTSCKREDAQGLDLFDPTTNAPSATSSTEERHQPMNDAGISVQHGQIWSSPARTTGSTPTSCYGIPILYLPHDIMATFSSGQIPSIPRDRFYADMEPRNWAGPNRKY